MTKRLDFRANQMKATKVTAGGEVKIIDSKNFPVTPISAAIVRLKPGGCANCTGIQMLTNGNTT